MSLTRVSASLASRSLFSALILCGALSSTASLSPACELQEEQDETLGVLGPSARRSFHSALVAFAASAAVDPLAVMSPDEVVDRFVAAKTKDMRRDFGLRMRVDLTFDKTDGSKKITGSGTRSISRDGTVTWDNVEYSPGGTVSEQFVTRFVNGDIEGNKASRLDFAQGDQSITFMNKRNYQFEFKNRVVKNGKVVAFVFHVSPYEHTKKRCKAAKNRCSVKHLVDEDLTIDAQTFYASEESGKSLQEDLERLTFYRKGLTFQGTRVDSYVRSDFSTAVRGFSGIFANPFISAAGALGDWVSQTRFSAFEILQ